MGTELTPEEVKFFETGDTSVLGLAEDNATAPAPVPAEAPPSPAPTVAPAVAPASDDPRILADRQRLDALQNTIAELAQELRRGPPKDAPQEPDKTEDPYGHMMHKLNGVTETVTQLRDQLQGQQQQTSQEAQFLTFVNEMKGVRDEFIKTTPDFHSAYEHLRAKRMEDLRDVGTPETQIPGILMNDEVAVSMHARQQGKNPAAAIYNMAKRYGYVAKAHPQDPAARVAALNAAQGVDETPGRGAKEGELTFEGLRDASEADLNKMVQDNKLWANLVGNTTNDIF